MSDGGGSIHGPDQARAPRARKWIEPRRRARTARDRTSVRRIPSDDDRGDGPQEGPRNSQQANIAQRRRRGRVRRLGLRDGARSRQAPARRRARRTRRTDRRNEADRVPLPLPAARRPRRRRRDRDGGRTREQPPRRRSHRREPRLPRGRAGLRPQRLRHQGDAGPRREADRERRRLLGRARLDPPRARRRGARQPAIDVVRPVERRHRRDLSGIGRRSRVL